MATADDTLRQRFVKLFTTENSRIAITIGPGLVWLIGLLLAPLIFLVAVSFTTTSASYQIIWEPTLASYTDLLIREDMAFWETPFFRSVILSYYIGAMTTVMTIIAAFPVAYVLARLDGRKFRILIYFVLLPFFTVYIVRAYSWFLMFGRSGIINASLMRLGLTQEPVEFFGYGVPAIIVALTHSFFPYMLLTLYASLDGLDFSLIEAARDLGAGRIGVVRDVIIPLTLPGLISGAVFVFVPAIGAFLTPVLLGQGKVLMVGQLIANRVQNLYAIGYGSAAAMFLMVSIIIAFAVAFRYVRISEIGESS